MEAIRIVLFATFAAILYGILHDQVTAHLCVEYFTIAHPPVFLTESPFLLAIGWGIIATWWVGLSLGIGLAAAARIGAAPKLSLAQLRRPILAVMLASALAALVAGIAGAVLAAQGSPPIPEPWPAIIPPEKHVAFAAVLWAHIASYAAGALFGLVLILHTAWRRVRG